MSKLFSVMNINGKMSSNVLEISSHLREAYEKIFNNESNYINGSIKNFLQSRLVLQNLPKSSLKTAERLDSQILVEEVDKAIGKLKKATSPGCDGVTPELILLIYEMAPALVVNFVKEFLEEEAENRLNLLVKI